jgi:pimeloyl-ACP methyl ester carboxylesterase
VAWPSEYQTFLPEVAEQYGRVAENHTAAARLVLCGDEPRPLAILIHGYLGGVHRTERRVWPMEFLRRIGMDAALFVLPFHGPRSAPRRLGQPPPFPGADPRITNEGFRQAIGDLSDFIRWLRDRGHPTVGAMGMSLGGYTTALAATADDELSFAVPIIPLASIADTARRHGRLGKTPAQTEAQFRALEAVYRIASPLHRAPVIAASNILVIAGERDQITPLTHARAIAEHFGCRIETWPGGHLVQYGRSDKFRSVGRFLNEIGVISRD